MVKEHLKNIKAENSEPTKEEALGAKNELTNQEIKKEWQRIDEIVKGPDRSTLTAQDFDFYNVHAEKFMNQGSKDKTPAKIKTTKVDKPKSVSTASPKKQSNQTKPITNLSDLKHLKKNMKNQEQKNNKKENKNTAEGKEAVVVNEIESTKKHVADVEKNAEKDNRNSSEKTDLSKTLAAFEVVRKQIRERIKAGKTINKNDQKNYDRLSKKLDGFYQDKKGRGNLNELGGVNISERINTENDVIFNKELGDFSKNFINDLELVNKNKEKELTTDYNDALENLKTFKDADNQDGQYAAALKWVAESEAALKAHKKLAPRAEAYKTAKGVDRMRVFDENNDAKYWESKKDKDGNVIQYDLVGTKKDSQEFLGINDKESTLKTDNKKVVVEEDVEKTLGRAEYDRKTDIYEKRVKRWGDIFQQGHISGHKVEKEEAEKTLRRALDTLNKHRAQEKFVIENNDNQKTTPDKAPDNTQKKDIKKTIDPEYFKTKLASLEKDLVIAENLLAEVEAGKNPADIQKAKDFYKKMKSAVSAHQNNAKFVKGYDDNGKRSGTENETSAETVDKKPATSKPENQSTADISVNQEYRNILAKKINKLRAEGKHKEANDLLAQQQKSSFYKEAQAEHRTENLEKRRAAFTGPLADQATKLGLTLNVVEKSGSGVTDADVGLIMDKVMANTNKSEKPKTLPGTPALKDQLEKRRARHQAVIDALELKGNLSEKEQKQLILKKEAVEILDKRISKTSDQIFEIENANAGRLEKMGNRMKHSFGKFKNWFGKPENQRKLVKRIVVSSLFTAGAAGATLLTGGAATAAMGIVGANATRFGLSYAGGEGLRSLYEGNKKDYRQVMADKRAGLGKIPVEFITGEKKIWKNEKFAAYQKRRDEMMNSSVDFIKNKNKWRNRFDIGGRALGSFSLNGVDALADLFNGETVAEQVAEQTQEVVENIDTGISKDIFINKGEGITHAFARQLNASQELRDALGVEGSTATGSDLARIAKQFGYINEDGADVRVFMGEGAGYELELDDNGIVKVVEHKGGHIDGDFYVGGHESDIHGDHVLGQDFEGENIEKQYEYLGNGQQTEVYQHNPSLIQGDQGFNTAFNSEILATSDSVDSISEGYTADNNYGLGAPDNVDLGGNLESRYLFQENLRTYPSQGLRKSTEGLLWGEFRNRPEDIYLKNLFQENGIAFNTETFKSAGFRYIDAEPGEGRFYHEAAGRNFTQREIYETININALKEKLGLVNAHATIEDSMASSAQESNAENNFGLGAADTPTTPGYSSYPYTAENNFGLGDSDVSGITPSTSSEVYTAENNYGLGAADVNPENTMSNEISPISVVENANGDLEVSLNADYEFLGNNNPGVISESDIANMESGDYTTGFSVKGESGIFKDMKILKMENGSYILQHTFPESGAFDSVYMDQETPEEYVKGFMEKIGLAEPNVASPEGSSDAYTRITEDQAKHIMNIYQELKKVSQ